jgi:hypothetical protein
VTPTADDVISALWRGNAQRTVAAMRMNTRSSRGHAILYLCIEELDGDHGKRMGKLTLVDLAGMESSKKSFAVDGPSNDPRRREEARHINTSLCALASVVAALSSGSSGHGATHVPYRDAKLTRLLQACALFARPLPLPNLVHTQGAQAICSNQNRAGTSRATGFTEGDGRSAPHLVSFHP